MNTYYSSQLKKEMCIVVVQAIGIEAIAIYNAWQASELTFWAPNINIFRDP